MLLRQGRGTIPVLWFPSLPCRQLLFSCPVFLLWSYYCRNSIRRNPADQERLLRHLLVPTALQDSCLLQEWILQESHQRFQHAAFGYLTSEDCQSPQWSPCTFCWIHVCQDAFSVRMQYIFSSIFHGEHLQSQEPPRMGGHDRALSWKYLQIQPHTSLLKRVEA